MSNDIDETAAGGRKNPDNRIVDATDILTGGDALDLVNVDSGDRAKTYLIDLDLIAAAFSSGQTLGQLNFFGNSGSQGTDGRETLDLLKEIEATGDNTRDPDSFVDDGGSRQRLELFSENDAGEAVASDDLLALILAAIEEQADLEFFETDTGFDIHIGGRWSTDILRFEGATAQQLVEDLLPPVNTAPVAVDDSFSFSQNSGAFVPAPGLFQNDIDADGDGLTVIAVNGSADNVGIGQISPSGIVNISILQDGGYFISVAGAELGEGESVTETVTYTISDGNGGTDTATVSVTVNGRNDDPDAVDDVITLTAGDTLTDVLALILANDGDVDGDDLSVTNVEFDPSFFGLAGFELEGDDDGLFTFEIDAFEGVSGTTSFTYEVSDGNGGTDTATVTVEIEGINSAPVAVDDSFTVVAGETTVNLYDLLLANDFDPDGDTFDISRVYNSSIPDGLGFLNVNVRGSTDLIEFRSNAGQTGTMTFEYDITDENGATDTGTVTIEVVAPDPGTEVFNDLLGPSMFLGPGESYTYDGFVFTPEDDTTFSIGFVDGNDAIISLSDQFSTRSDSITISKEDGGLFSLAEIFIEPGATLDFDFTISGSSGADDFEILIEGANANDVANLRDEDIPFVDELTIEFVDSTSFAGTIDAFTFLV